MPLVADEVTRGGKNDSWALRVASCRPKPDWIYPLTVRFADEFFQVAGESPAGEAYRGVREYDPNALLREPAEQPNFLLQYFRQKAERWRVQRLPAAPDVVERGDGARGWHLRIESRREKPEWTLGRTIRFEEEMFRVSEIYRGAATRPFGFHLRKLAENEAARGVLDYWPE